MIKITAAILTKNNERSIKKTLLSCQFFDEILILDTGSSDRTIDIAESFKNVRIERTKFTSFGEMRNSLAKFARNDWVLAIDSDEVISEDLQKEIQDLTLKNGTLYSIPFINFFNEKKIKWCGWKESHVRLYRRDESSFSSSHIHEKLQVKNLKIKNLKSPIYHYSYNSIEDFLKKMQIYSSLFAKEHRLRKKSSLFKAIYHSLFAFFKSYIIKRGILGGKEGFIISVYNANTAFYKYLKLAEINNKK